MPVPEDINAEVELGGMDEDEPDDQIIAMLMQTDLETGEALRDQIIPFAVRWYTGEACPDMEDDDDEDEEEEDDEDEDDEDEDEEDEDEPAPKKGAKKGKAGKDSPGMRPGADPKQEEC